MSGNIRLNDQQKEHTGQKTQEPTPIGPRLQWIADLVCALLNAENTKRPIINGEETHGDMTVD
jgi:hypothetical protein